MASGPVYQNFMKAGAKDPRLGVRTSIPYSPTIQADRLQVGQRIQAERGNTIPLGQAKDQATLSAPSLLNTIRVDYSYFAVTNSQANVSTLLVPRNPGRSSLIVSNNSIATGMNIILSFGRVINTTNIASVITQGILLAPGQQFEEHEGLVSIDEIYVCPASDATGNAYTVVAFEGSPALQQVAT